MKRIALLIVLTALATLASCGEDYSVGMVKKADMQAVIRASYEVRPWEEKSIAAYFISKAGDPMTVGEVVTSAGEGGKTAWKSSKVADAVRVVEVNVVTAHTEKNVALTFRVNVETGEVVIDDLEIENILGEKLHGIDLFSLMALDVYSK